MTEQALSEILDSHKKWRASYGSEGARADLSDADLSRADLSDANLSGADLSGADLSRANLIDANLIGANLIGANLSRANLSGANLIGANLSRANLSGADLSGADLSGADLSRANLPAFYNCPDFGSFTAWKKLRGGVIAQLEIPAEAKRISSLVGRKCRAEFARVIALNGLPEGRDFAVDMHTGKLEYRVGATVYPDAFDDDIRAECKQGIHYFITRAEAEAY